jgi:PKD repeat protein
LLSCDNVQWTFGDGSTSESETSARNTYSAPGTYQVTLVVSNEFGTSSPATANITIVAAPSSCSIAPHEGNILIKYHGLESGCRDSNVTPCKKNEQINFEAGKFGYDFQSCDTFEWTWGDGSAKSTAQNPSHVFTANGNSFTVSLKVANANGGATVTREVSFGQSTPTQPQPVLTFDNFPSAGTKNKPVTFKVNSNIDATGWTWSFGDGTPDDTSQSGSTAKTKSITHTFASAGQFTVRVFARNAAGAASDTPGAVQAKITVTEAPPEPEYRYLLPVVTHIGGQGGSTWRTDVQIYSQDPTVSPAKPLTMTALLRDNVLGEITRTLEVPSSTYIYEDFMRVFYNGNGSGPVIITAKGQYAPQIWTRTYNQTEAGTFGQFIPAIRIDDAGAGSAFGDGKYYLAGLRHDDSYRTNFGLVNPNSSAVNVQMRVYDDQGLPLGTFTRTLQSFQLDQFPIVGPGALSSITNTRPFSIEIEVPSGQWLIAYASLINRGSNDPVFLQAVRESELASADYRSIVLPGVGHTGDWRSDVTVFNPNGRKINVDLAYHDGAGVKRGEALGVPIGAGEFLQYNDLLHQGVFGTVPDGVGILRVTVPESIAADRFPLVVARTFNDNGTGKTFGQGITGFAVPRANVKPNKPALIPAVRDNTKFYTNVGLTNTTNAVVNATVKLLDPGTGAEVKSVGFTLQPYQSIVGRYTLDGRDNASLKVEADGNIWAFVSIIDKFTFDPEYVPATPLQ